jgi:hypothetical protein
MHDTTYEEVSKLVDHYRAIGIHEVWLRGDLATMPWHIAKRIGPSGSYRLNSPCGCRVTAEENGMKYTWSFDFEGAGANGSGTHQFDEAVMLGAARHMPVAIREQYAALLVQEVLPAVKKNADEAREYLSRQERSERVILAVIASAA